MSLRKSLIRVESYLDEYKRKTKEKLGLFETSIAYPFLGYGNDTHAVLKGRVLEKKKIIHGDDGKDHGLFHNSLRFLKRYESDEIPGVTIKATFAGKEEIVTSDEDGFFLFRFDYKTKPEPGWHDVTLEVIHCDYSVPMEKFACAEIFIPYPEAEFGIISDVDDTLIESNATNLLERIKTMLRHSASTRPVFDGARDLYEALSRNFRNPIWFVSGSSYNLHDLLRDLCEHNNIPKAPCLLRDLGLDDSQWLKKDTAPYKMKHIRHLFDMYPDMSFILIGDSGQKDPEIFEEVVKEYPGRIMAAYIRHVADEDRESQVRKIAENMNSPMKLFQHSQEVLDHLNSRILS